MLDTRHIIGRFATVVDSGCKTAPDGAIPLVENQTVAFAGVAVGLLVNGNTCCGKKQSIYGLPVGAFNVTKKYFPV